MNDSYVEENAAARDRLAHLAATLTDEDLARTVPNGMTVASVLAHLAYWDAYCLAQLKRWAKEGVSASGGDLEASNAGVRLLADAIPPRTAVALALSAADAVDAHVATLDPEFVRAVKAAHLMRIVRRSRHRTTHLDQIEAALQD